MPLHLDHGIVRMCKSHAPEENPGGDELFVGSPWRLQHDVQIRGIEAKSGGWRPISDQVDPEQLDRNEVLGETQRSRYKDTSDLANVAADHVADKRLHVVVNCSALFHSRHLMHP